jgi:hypothetical protein
MGTEIMVCADCGHGRGEDDFHFRFNTVEELCKITPECEFIEVWDADTKDVHGYECGRCRSENMKWENK